MILSKAVRNYFQRGPGKDRVGKDWFQFDYRKRLKFLQLMTDEQMLNISGYVKGHISNDQSASSSNNIYVLKNMVVL